MKKTFGISVVGIIVFLSCGCSSVPLRTGALPNKEYKVVGRSAGSAGGFMLFQFIPIKHNSKVERAYKEAVTKLNGDDMINLTISERWYWAYIGDGYRVNMEGDVIKYTGSGTK